jgi:hypothetical protein
LIRLGHGEPRVYGGFLGVLNPSPQLSMECFRKVTVAIVEHRSNLILLHLGGDAMYDVCGELIQGDYQIRGLVAGCAAVYFCHGLQLPSEHSP